MRVTNQLLERSLLRYLSTSLAQVAKTQEHVATGVRVHAPSDDPTAAALILDIDHQLRYLNQFQRHTGAARARVTAEDSVVQQTQDLMDRARQLTLGGAGSSATPSSMSASATEIGHIISQIRQTGNTKVGNEYIFGGTRTDVPPFQAGVYVGNGSIRQLEIADGQLIDTNHTGDQLFVTSGILQSLTDIQTALQSGDPAQVRAAAPALDVAANNLQTLQSEVGARLRSLDHHQTLREQIDLDLRERRTDLAEVDFEKATTEFLTAQTVLEAARATASRVLQTTLTDFLR